jgi:hypothetical protein
MTDAPLIFTTKGNLRVDTLTHEVAWRHSPGQVVFIERYYLDGEMVKASSHVCVLDGATSIGDVGAI